MSKISYAAIITVINTDGSKDTFSLDGIEAVVSKEEAIKECQNLNRTDVIDLDQWRTDMIGAICDTNRDIRKGVGSASQAILRAHKGVQLVSALCTAPFWKAEVFVTGPDSYDVSLESMPLDEWKEAEKQCGVETE